MADEKAGKKPEKEGGAGTEKDEAESVEAGGRHRHRLLYTCWNDGAGGLSRPIGIKRPDDCYREAK